jgi:hypothetical protein
MQNIQTTLTPGAPTPFQVKGTVLQITSSGNSAGLQLDFYQGGRIAYTVKGALTGWKLKPTGGFDGIAITSATGDTIGGIVTTGDVDITIVGSTVVENTVANPVPVNIAGGSVNVTASNITVANTSADPVPVSLVSDPEGSLPVTVGNTTSNPVPVSMVSEPGAPFAVTISNAAAAPVPVYDAYQAPVTTAWTSATAANTAETITTQGFDTVIFTIAPSGTITAGAITFEVYDGTNWITLKAPRTDSYLTDTTFALAGAGIHSWQLPVAGYPQVRARLSTAITGSGTVNLVAIASSAPDVSLVTVGLDPNQPLPAGTNTIGAVTVANLNTAPVLTSDVQGVQRSLNGNTYGGTASAGGGASTYAYVQLWNPVGSGVSLYVQNVGAGGASWLGVAGTTTQAATLSGNGVSKNLSKGAAAGQVRYSTLAALGNDNTWLGVVGNAGTNEAPFPLNDLIIVPPGYGLNIICNTTNTAMNAGFEWYEQ